MQHQLEQLELARKKFIATASHELRTPVFSLGGFLELLEDEDLDAETRRRFLDQVGDQVRRLGKLSVDLLDLSRLEAGSLDLNPEEVDLGELTRSVSGEFEPTLAQHDSRLELRLPARRIEAQCDPGAGGSDHAHPDRQRADPQSPGDADHGHRRPRERQRPPGRARQRARASIGRSRSGSSSPSTPPTMPRARGSGWPSPASWPSECRARCRSTPLRGPPSSGSSSPAPEALSSRPAQPSISASQTSLRVGKAGIACMRRSSGTSADDRDRRRLKPVGDLGSGERGPDDQIAVAVNHEPRPRSGALADKARPRRAPDLGVDGLGADPGVERRLQRQADGGHLGLGEHDPRRSRTVALALAAPGS